MQLFPVQKSHGNVSFPEEIVGTHVEDIAQSNQVVLIGLSDAALIHLDWYAEGADYCVAGSDVTAPTGPTTGSGRVVRGGSYAHDHTIARSAYRYKNGQPPGTAYTTLAYRLVCPVDMRTAEDGVGTEGKPVAAFADVTGFDPVVVDSDGAGGFGTAAAPLDFKARFDVLINGLDFDSRKPFGFHLILR